MRAKAVFLDTNIIVYAYSVVSEDMQHGFLVDGQLRIENPFLAGV